MHFWSFEWSITNEKCELSSWQPEFSLTAQWQLIPHHALTTTQPRAWIWPTVSPTWDWRPKNTAWTRYPPSTEVDSRAVRDSERSQCPHKTGINVVFCPPICVLLLSINSTRKRELLQGTELSRTNDLHKTVMFWACGKIQFWKAQNGNFSLFALTVAAWVWSSRMKTVAYYRFLSRDRRDLMTSAESIYYNLVDIWEVFRISPRFLLGTHNHALRPQIGIWIFWLFGTGWNLATLLTYSKITLHRFQFKTRQGYLFILAYSELLPYM